jgi:thiamine-phosphate pyrophosphorylase
MDPSQWRVYLVTQENLSAGRSTEAIVDAAIAGGVDAVQLREKGTSARDRYELGRLLRERTAEAGVDLIVNDRADVAAAVDADGVHVGGSDLPVEAARNVVGSDAVVGRSVSTVAAAEAAADAGADYLGVGSVYATSSKDVPDEEAAIGVDRVAAIADAVGVPVVGIGGIDADNAGDVAAAGATGVAVISAITGTGDPEAATRTLREVVTDAR